MTVRDRRRHPQSSKRRQRTRPPKTRGVRSRSQSVYARSYTYRPA
ncbi:hypothetical protein KLEB271_gp105 [Bacillus phage vB_BauS_KLEB27-1]|nr:hypothetical protein KLEB271_gp105 [Bacillus phage vB_BauS_KLEB27-1]